MRSPLPREGLAPLLFLLAGCAGQAHYGGAGDGPFAPPSERELQRLLGDYPSPGPNASSELRDAAGHAVPFPARLAAFADQVVAYEVGAPSPIPEGEDPETALGPPDYKADIWDRPHAVSLGNGGSLTLHLAEPALTDSDGPDLFLFEVGPSVEAMLVDVSTDGQGWIPVGEAPGGASCLDIGPKVPPGEVFHYVRIRDIPHQGGESDAFPGADVDAVGTRGLVERVALPSEVLFASGSATLMEGAGEKLDPIVLAIQRGARKTVTVVGHTDDVGAPLYNQRLSEQRAAAVAAYLENKGIPKDQITARGYGESRPIAPGRSEPERRKNRRVEILIEDR